MFLFVEESGQSSINTSLKRIIEHVQQDVIGGYICLPNIMSKLSPFTYLLPFYVNSLHVSNVGPRFIETY